MTISIEAVDSQGKDGQSDKASVPENWEWDRMVLSNNRLNSISKRFVLVALLATPLLFGSVHWFTFLPLALVCMAACLLSLGSKESGAIAQLFRDANSSFAVRTPLTLIALFLLYVAVLQPALFSMLKLPHPVIDSYSKNINITHSYSGVLSFVTFFGLTLLVWANLRLSPGFGHQLQKILVAAGFIVSLIALGHWLYDNGKLFWIFSPRTVYISERARWPFVNPNHLGNYLLPILFFAISGLQIRYTRLAGHFEERNLRSIKALANRFSSRRVQSAFSSIILASLVVFTILLAIIATQSRGTWFGLITGVLAWALFTKRLAKSAPSEGSKKKRAPDSMSYGPMVDKLYRSGAAILLRRSKSIRRRNAGPSKPKSLPSPLEVFGVIKRFRFVILALLIVVLVSFFLNQSGRDLVEARFNYSIAQSKDDIRFKMLADSLPIFTGNALLGIGVGNWETLYQSNVRPELAGLNPVYLHSDPLQLLLETGTLGVIPLLTLTLLLTMRVRRLIAQVSQETRPHILTLLPPVVSALIGIISASLFEFPFRIPAISCLFATLLGLTLFYCTSSDITE